jgi:putative DNA primase/helicase
MKLADELAGIFAWLVQGCLQWQRESLKVPLEVREATQEYKSQTDILPQFLKDCCLVDITKKVPSRELYEAYRGWAANNADEVLTQKAFGSYLKTAGYKPAKSNGVRYWKGLELKKGENNDSSAENPKEAISEPNSLFPMTE